MMNYVRRVVIVGIGTAASFQQTFAQATNPGPAAGGIRLQDPLGGATFTAVLATVIKAATLIATPILALMVVVGGFQIMAARDNKEAALKGRQTLYNAAIGFGVILVANGVGAIIKSLLGP